MLYLQTALCLMKNIMKRRRGKYTFIHFVPNLSWKKIYTFVFHRHLSHIIESLWDLLSKNESFFDFTYISRQKLGFRYNHFLFVSFQKSMQHFAVCIWKYILLIIIDTDSTIKLEPCTIFLKKVTSFINSKIFANSSTTESLLKNLTKKNLHKSRPNYQINQIIN